MVELLNSTLQENVITLLAHNDEQGKVVASLVDPQLFEGEYRVIAARLLTYWKQFQQAPKVHTADLFADILEDPGNRKSQTYRRILTNMLALSEGVNTAYVVDQVRLQHRTIKLKAAIIQGAELLHAKEHHAIEEVESIWNEVLRGREIDFDPGIRLSEFDRVLDYLARQFSEFRCGIQVLDDHNIVPYRGGVMLLLGAAGRGKSWGLIHLGKHALLQRKKIVHVTLEMSSEEVLQRYYQSLFAAPKRDAEIQLTRILRSKNEVKGFEEFDIRPEFAFDSPHIRDELETRISWQGNRFENMIVKRFPPRSLSPDMLRGYLDNLEVTEKFIPDMVILDYLGIMKTDAKNHRISLGRVAEDFRAICVERHVAGVTAHQISKAGAEALQSQSTHVAEDWSLIATHDQVITYSSTDQEHKYGLARLFVAKARSEEDKFGALITQNYQTGQFCLDSAFLSSDYFDILHEYAGDEEETEQPEDDEDDE